MGHDVSTRRVSSRIRYSSLDPVLFAQAEFLSQWPRRPHSPKLALGPVFESPLPQLREYPSRMRPCGPCSFLRGVRLRSLLQDRRIASPDIEPRGHMRLLTLVWNMGFCSLFRQSSQRSSSLPLPSILEESVRA